GEREEIRRVKFNVMNGGFGLDPGKRKTTHERDMLVRTMQSVLEEAGPVDVIKCDCEGGEIGFRGVSRELLRRAEAYVMETHSSALAKAMVTTFTAAGFRAELQPGGMKMRPFFKFTRE
ncbi:MAG: hypothetical protein M3Z05_21930, partial [Gemmatimonadota bacterium]|nr:hypothetical protein [Gemmatimonadota bacterium]